VICHYLTHYIYYEHVFAAVEFPITLNAVGARAVSPMELKFGTVIDHHPEKVMPWVWGLGAREPRWAPGVHRQPGLRIGAGRAVSTMGLKFGTVMGYHPETVMR
jgi:hypothetical protein